MRTTSLLLMLITSACAAPTTAMVECPPKGCRALDPPTPRERALLAHAELDLQCPRAQLDIEQRDAWTSWVLGCGHAARYAWILQRDAEGSRWILDSPILGARRD